jgi:hypothetical protein
MYFTAVAANLTGAASAQSGEDPREVLGMLISAFQNCGPPQAYQVLSPQLFNLIAAQTGGSGCYAPIRGAGPVTGMQVIQSQNYPIGPVYLIRVTHQAGPADWFIGFNRSTGRVEYLSFQAAQPGTTIETGPSPGAGGPSPSDSPTPPPPPGDDPDGCSLYPAMCQ